MIFEETPLKGSYTINLELTRDERGFFARYLCLNELKEAGLNTRWVQVNNSLSLKRGVVRGLHFQRPPHAEVKLVRCISGAIWDVIVDLRAGSSTYGQWYGAVLTNENRVMMYVPEGFAHGFLTLAPDSEVLYHVSNFYCPDAEQTLLWSDKSVGIDWPETPSIVSEKDSHGEGIGSVEAIVLE